MILFVIAGILLLGLLLWIVGLLLRRTRRSFVRGLMSFMSRILLEVKLVLIFLVWMFLMLAANDLYYDPVVSIFIAAGLLVIWYLLMDLFVNRSKTFKNNFPMLLVRGYRTLERKKPFQKALILRIYMLLAAESVLVFLSALFCLLIAAGGGDGAVILLLLTLLMIASGVFLLYRFVRRYRLLVNDIGSLIDQIALIRSGEMNAALSIAPDNDLFRAADDLNNIQEGLLRAIAERTKSERMKIELITNVSHDLKTPLTSIISYADLLAQETLAPTEANDYVQVIRQKAERLNKMTRDLFELSKAQSGNLEINLERLDLVEHVRQSLAELDEKIAESGLTFITSLPDAPVFIMADGGRLYRVFENLVVNALKYSLPGTRVYVQAAVSSTTAVIEIKNISAHPLDFNADEITERFTRGDSARTTEGSGLGLAIVRSFTESCRGRFRIVLDGDLFKAVLEFPLAR